MTTLKIANLVPDHVLSVYSGKPGCACGCRGKHSANPTHREEAVKNCGCELDKGEFNVVQVARVLKIVKASFANPIPEEERGVQSNLDGEAGKILSVETESRLYIVYLRAGVSVLTPEQAEVEREVAVAEGRLAGLRFRAAELRAA